MRDPDTGLTRTIGSYVKDGKKVVCVDNAGRNPIRNKQGIGFDIFYTIAYCKSKCVDIFVPDRVIQTCPACIRKGDDRSKYFKVTRKETRQRRVGYSTISQQANDHKCINRVDDMKEPCDVPTCDYVCVKAWSEWDHCSCSAECGYKFKKKKEYVVSEGSANSECILQEDRAPCPKLKYGYLFVNFDAGSAQSAANVFDSRSKAKKRASIINGLRFEWRGPHIKFFANNITFLDCDNPDENSWNQYETQLPFECNGNSAKDCWEKCIKSGRTGATSVTSSQCYEACPVWDEDSDKDIAKRSADAGFVVYYSVEGALDMNKDWQCDEAQPGSMVPLGGQCTPEVPPSSWGAQDSSGTYYTGAGAPEWKDPAKAGLRIPLPYYSYQRVYDYPLCRSVCKKTTTTVTTTTTTTTTTRINPCKGSFVWDGCTPCQNLVDTDNTLRCGYEYGNFVQDFYAGYDISRMEQVKTQLDWDDLSEQARSMVKWAKYDTCTFRMVEVPRKCALPCTRKANGEYDWSTCKGECYDGQGLKCVQNMKGCIVHQAPVLCSAAGSSQLNCQDIQLVDSPISRQDANEEALKLTRLRHHARRYVECIIFA